MIIIKNKHIYIITCKKKLHAHSLFVHTLYYIITCVYVCAISVNLICATANSNFIQPAESIAGCLRTSAGPRQQLDSRGRKRIPQPRRNRKWVHSQLLLQNRKIVRSPHPTSPPACSGSGFCTWQDPRHTARLLRHALPACRGTHCWRRMLGCKPCSCHDHLVLVWKKSIQASGTIASSPQASQLHKLARHLEDVGGVEANRHEQAVAAPWKRPPGPWHVLQDLEN